MANAPGYLPLNQRRSKATYSDLSKDFGTGGSDLLFDSAAISQSLHNLFSTTIGEAGPIFNPEFGSLLPQLLQEPMDDVTLFKLRAATIQAVQRWEPRIQVDNQNTDVTADYQNLAYRVVLAYTIRKTGEQAAANLTISLLPDFAPTAPYSTLDYAISYHLIGWPGMYEYCILSGSTLRYSAEPFWSGINSWVDWVDWGTVGAVSFLRFTAVVDRGLTDTRRLAADFRGDTTQTILVECATSPDGIAYSAYFTLTCSPITSRFYKIRVTATSSYPTLSFGNLLFFV